jgi:predicted RNase H-like HicB family nuclease
MDAAMSRTHYEWLNADVGFYGHIPALPGVWATGETQCACETELREVLEDWILGGKKLGLRLSEGFDAPPS